MASNQSGKRLEPVIGADGRLYYNYGVGASYRIRDADGSEVLFEIIACRYSDSCVEYYTCTRNGAKSRNEYSANRIHIILHYDLFETLSEGKCEELPLTVTEVTAYAQGIAQAKASAVQSLKNTDYFAKEKELKSIMLDKAFAEVKGQVERVAELEERERQLFAKQQSILQSKKIDPRILRETVFCTACNETGIKGIRVCACAQKQSKEIKDYNAVLRRTSKAVIK